MEGVAYLDVCVSDESVSGVCKRTPPLETIILDKLSAGLSG